MTVSKITSKTISKKLLTTSILASTMSIASMVASTSAAAEATSYDQLSFRSEAKAEIENNEVQASMYKKVQQKSAKALAVELNTAMNKAIKIAKRYPTVTVSTGQQNTYPQYNQGHKIIGWTGQSSINIKSIDLESASQLIADLQESLVLDNLNFGVSEERQDKLEQELMTKVSKKFQQQAKKIVNDWGATGYRIVKVDLNTGSNYDSYPMMRSQSFAMKTTSTPAPQFEAGNSSVSVTANGIIELIR